MSATPHRQPTAAGEAALYDPLSPSFRIDPYPALHRLRAVDPVHWSPGGYCWILTRYEDIRLVLYDRRFGIALDWLEQIDALKPVFAEPFNRILKGQILSADPPDHPRIRRIMAPHFSGVAVEALRSRVQRVVDRILDEVVPRGRMDVMRELARPVPFAVIAELLEMPAAIWPELECYTRQLMRTTDPHPMSRAELDEANQAAVGFRLLFLAEARRRRGAETRGLFEDLVAARDAGVISEGELVSNLILLFCAGHDTVVNLLGNGLLALHRSPGELGRLRDDPSLIRSAVEELLRIDTTLQIARRVALEDVVVGGVAVTRGSYLLCFVSAANRDPAVFPDPDRLDVGRKGGKVLSFGGGIHHCLGAALARLEGEVVFSSLLTRLPGLRLDTLDPPWTQNVFLRGLASLPASW